MKKKNYAQETGIGYCPFSLCAGSRYSKLYRDTTEQGRAVGGHDTANSPATRPHDKAGPRARACGKVRARACGKARARGLASRVCCNTIICIVKGGVGLASRHDPPRAAIRGSSAL